MNKTGGATSPGARTGIGAVLLATVCVLFGADAPACELGGASCGLDPARVRWREIDLETRKFFLSGSTAARVDLVDGDRPDLIPVDEGVPVAPGARVVELRAASRGLGVNSSSVLWIDPYSGAALQYQVDDSGRRLRRRVYRYTNQGAFHRTRHPAEGEDDRPPEQWSDIESGLRPYAPEAVDQIVVDPISLLYIIAASGLMQPGDSLEMYAFARRQTTRLTLTVDEQTAVDKRLAGKLSRADLGGCEQPSEFLLVRLSPVSLRPQEDSKFSFLGLQSDIRVWLDPVNRLPLRVTGKVNIAGKVTINLRSAACV